MKKRVGHKSSLDAGMVIGGHEIIRELGDGGMSVVYLANDPVLKRHVALKVLAGEFTGKEARARFLREARSLAPLDHPHVVRVYSSGTDGDSAWMSLEYVDGDPLVELTGSKGLDEETALSLIAQTARGLSAVHTAGIIHRDIKPDNLLLDDSGLLRIVDFGIAHIEDPEKQDGFQTREGLTLGTPHYMSPEQARGIKVDERADTWALGMTLFSLLTGKPAFYKEANEPTIDILTRVVNDDIPTVPNISRETSAFMAQLLNRNLDERPRDMIQIAERAEAIADNVMQGIEEEVGHDLHQPAAPEAPRPKAPISAPLNPPVASVRSSIKLLLASAAFIFLGVAGSAIYIGLNSKDKNRNGDQASTEEPGAGDLKFNWGKNDPPAPAAKSLEERIREPSTRKGALKELFELEDPKSIKLRKRLVVEASEVGTQFVDAVARSGHKDRIDLLTRALMQDDEKHALHAVRTLEELRNVRALESLRKASQDHSDKKVRAAAKRAANSIFRVE